MIKLAAVSLAAVCLLPSSSLAKTTPSFTGRFASCVFEGIEKKQAVATSCDPVSGEGIAVLSDRIVSFPRSEKTNGITVDRIEVSLASTIQESGQIVSASIKSGLIYFLTDQGWLFRYAKKEAVALLMADVQLTLASATAKVSLIDVRGTEEFVSVVGRDRIYPLRFDSSEQAFFFENL